MKSWCHTQAPRGLLAVLTILGVTATAVGADLSAEQQQLLQQAHGQLKNVIDNYKPALDSAGPKGKPKGSKLKLAMMRLNTAKAPLPQIETLLGKLPADNADVQAFKKQYDDIKAKVEALEMRLTGKSAEDNAKANEGVKLDYKQEEQLKNARFYLQQIQGIDETLKKVIAQIEATPDIATFDHQILVKAGNTVTKVQEHIKHFKDHFDTLPPDGRGVQATLADMKKALASIDQDKAAINPTYDKVMGLINTANYPTLGEDLERLGDMGGMYANVDVLNMDPIASAPLVSEMPAAIVEHNRIVAEYAIFVTQKTETGKRLSSLSRYFSDNFTRFSAAAEQRKVSLPMEIQKELDEIDQMTRRAVEEQKPLFFTGGIPQHFGWIETKVVLCEAFDPAAAADFKKKIEAMKIHVQKSGESLREVIIAANKLPEDNYKGEDRAEVTKMATDAWKKEQPDAEILAVRIPSEAWKHELIWRNQTGSWYKIDRSKLQVHLAVKYDDKLAVIRPINLWKDHMKGDAVNAFPFHDKEYELQPQNFMLLENVK